jgi:hypothetical protein
MRKLIAFLFAVLFSCTAYADSIITGSKPFTFTPGTVISSSQVNADFDYIINQTNTNAAKNGVNSSITALLGLTTPIDPGSGGSPVYNGTTVGGTGDAITITATRPAISSFSYITGNIVTFIATNTNTTLTPTINVNSLGAKNIYKYAYGGVVTGLSPGDIRSGNPIWLYYDGTEFFLVSLPQDFGNNASTAAAATTDIGAQQSHLITITGNTGITAFGSNANVGDPYYFVRFTGTPTITFNATSVITPGGGNIQAGAGDTAILEYLGSGNWRIDSYIPVAKAPSIGTVNNLLTFNNATTPTTKVDITADGAILCNTSEYCVKVTTVSLTIDASTTGANGLDTGSLANNTWYYSYIISNGTTTAGLLSTSATAPTMPSGYVYKYRIGAIRTLGAATFVRIRQAGNRAMYTVITGSTTPNYPVIASGTSGNISTPTYTAIATGSFVPTTAQKITGFLFSNYTTGQAVMLAPNNNFGNNLSTTIPAPTLLSSVSAGQKYDSIPFEFVLESTDLRYASNAANTSVFCSGWVDAVNAN